MITLVADVSAPTASQVLSSYAAMRQGDRLIVAVTRADAHFVTTLAR